MSSEAEAKPIEQGYVLPRSSLESQRLDKQHFLFADIIGYLINPSVQQKLGPNACLADVATGTGIWLTELAKSYPSTVQFYGFDLSTAQYPEKGILPNNVTLKQHNAKEAFPAEFHQKFDLVQLRFISGGMADGDWKLVTNNVLETLKPGGAIQWIEPDYLVPLEAQHTDGSVAVAHVTQWQLFLDVAGLAILKEKGPTILPQVFSDAGMTGVTSTVANPRTSERRDEWGMNLIDVIFQTLEGLAKRGAKGAVPVEEAKKLQADALEEFRQGARYSMPVYVIVGFKPE